MNKAKPCNGSTALHVAAEEGHVPVIELLMSKGASAVELLMSLSCSALAVVLPATAARSVR